MPGQTGWGVAGQLLIWVEGLGRKLLYCAAGRCALAAAAAAPAGAASAGRAGLLFVWAIYSRWVGEVVTAVGYLLPLDYEILLMSFGTAVDLLNNRRLCGYVAQQHRHPGPCDATPT